MITIASTGTDDVHRLFPLAVRPDQSPMVSTPEKVSKVGSSTCGSEDGGTVVVEGSGTVVEPGPAVVVVAVSGAVVPAESPSPQAARAMARAATKATVLRWFMFPPTRGRRPAKPHEGCGHAATGYGAA